MPKRARDTDMNDDTCPKCKMYTLNDDRCTNLACDYEVA